MEGARALISKPHLKLKMIKGDKGIFALCSTSSCSLITAADYSQPQGQGLHQGNITNRRHRTPFTSLKKQNINFTQQANNMAATMTMNTSLLDGTSTDERRSLQGCGQKYWWQQVPTLSNNIPYVLISYTVFVCVYH